MYSVAYILLWDLAQEYMNNRPQISGGEGGGVEKKSVIWEEVVYKAFTDTQFSTNIKSSNHLIRL